MKPELIIIKETCTALGCSPNTVYKLLREKRLDSIKIGKARRVTIASLKKLLKSAEAVE